MDNEVDVVLDYERRRRATECTATCYLAAFARAYWDDFEAFLKDHDEEAAYFLPIVEEWRERHALYQAVRAQLPPAGVSDDALRAFGRRMRFLAEDIERQSEASHRAQQREMRPEARVAEALLPLVGSLRAPAHPRIEDGDDLIDGLIEARRAASGVHRRVQGKET